MSFVGTRPEATKYVEKYSNEMLATLLLPAGITSEASIRYKDEAELLDSADDVDRVYIEKVLPEKMKYNLQSIKNFCFIIDVCITVCVAGRNLEKMHKRYETWKDNNLKIFKYDVLKAIIFDYEVDYVIHAAGNAHPLAFNSDPVGTIIGNIEGTYNLLEYTKAHGGKRFLFVSSGEVYGNGDLSLDEFKEEYLGAIDITSPRSCYPQSKRAVENLCASYSSQYELETVVVRPCHT